MPSGLIIVTGGSRGIGAATVQHSGKIDVHMVTHDHAKPALTLASLTPRQRHLTSWLAAVIVFWSWRWSGPMTAGPRGGSRRN